MTETKIKKVMMKVTAVGTEWVLPFGYTGDEYPERVKYRYEKDRQSYDQCALWCMNERRVDTGWLVRVDI